MSRAVGVGAAVAVALLVVAGCADSPPKPEDHRRMAIISSESILELDIEGAEPLGPVSTALGHGSGPTYKANTARRRFVITPPVADLMRPLHAAAQQDGWEITRSRERTDPAGGTIIGRKTVDDVPMLLTVNLFPFEGETHMTIEVLAERAEGDQT